MKGDRKINNKKIKIKPTENITMLKDKTSKDATTTTNQKKVISRNHAKNFNNNDDFNPIPHAKSPYS